VLPARVVVDVARHFPIASSEADFTVHLYHPAAERRVMTPPPARNWSSRARSTTSAVLRVGNS
jgi:hypothetical protein